ncbi:hypothetical protein [Emticicia sp.]|uniref:hypothetical protein n=1 Tax=Emticicia sp. TaxID=1930953 RepID=UPI0037524B82
MAIFSLILGKDDIETTRIGHNFKIKTTNGIEIIFTPESLIEIHNDFLKLSECNGNCGMNYCDDNGCIDRKRHLVNPQM